MVVLSFGVSQVPEDRWLELHRINDIKRHVATLINQGVFWRGLVAALVSPRMLHENGQARTSVEVRALCWHLVAFVFLTHCAPAGVIDHRGGVGPWSSGSTSLQVHIHIQAQENQLGKGSRQPIWTSTASQRKIFLFLMNWITGSSTSSQELW